MNRERLKSAGRLLAVSAAIVAIVTCAHEATYGQEYDFKQLEKHALRYNLIIDMQVEYSFGMQTNEQEHRLLGTVVTDDGLVLFDGSFLSDDSPMAPFVSLSFRATPTKTSMTTIDGKKYEAEYVGVDSETGLGFARVTDRTAGDFKPVKFNAAAKVQVGDWVALHYLLPEFVKPPLASDVGMISALVEVPEEFPLTVGFGSVEMGSVLYDERLNVVGVLGVLNDPLADESGSGGMFESFGGYTMPLFGVISVERLEKLIASPPKKGQVDRSWLGITLQALTEDIADFLGIEVAGGIILNDVVPSSPAGESGLMVGDVIYEINGQPVEVNREEEISIFQRKIASMGAGTSVEFSVLRAGTEDVDSLKVLTVLQAAPLAAADAEEHEDEHFELRVRDLVFSDFMHFNVEQGELRGVVISELRRGGLANLGGLNILDVIQRVNNRTVSSVEEFVAAMEAVEAEKPEEIVFFVWRFGKTMFVNVKTEW